jgi:hypothetical protein
MRSSRKSKKENNELFIGVNIGANVPEAEFKFESPDSEEIFYEYI